MKYWKWWYSISSKNSYFKLLSSIKMNTEAQSRIKWGMTTNEKIRFWLKTQQTKKKAMRKQMLKLMDNQKGNRVGPSHLKICQITTTAQKLMTLKSLLISSNILQLDRRYRERKNRWRERSKKIFSCKDRRQLCKLRHLI